MNGHVFGLCDRNERSAEEAQSMSEGLRITRRFTEAGKDPYDQLEWSTRDSRIANPDGSVVFEMTDAEIPAQWSQVASDIMVSKYFRKAGIPQYDDEGKALADDNGDPVTGPERSAKQVFDRLVGTWKHWGEKEGYFASAEDAKVFEDELRYMLATQMAAPNSPQWFNTGLNWAYGLTGPPQGLWYVDGETEKLTSSPDSYSRPTPQACYILGVSDDLVNPGGIMDLWVREARIFKFGSGAGSNFSAIRGENEQLSGGGKSSGVMSFLKIGDRAAGAIKSGGTTRRAAKMVILDGDHPDIEMFIDWKKIEEEKAKLLINHGGFPADFNGEAYATVSGQNSNNSVRITNDFVKSTAPTGQSERQSKRAICGHGSPRLRGHVPTPASSSTPQSTSGTPVRPVVEFGHLTLAVSTSFWTTPHATWRRSIWSGSMTTRPGSSTSTPTSTPFASGPSCWRSRWRWHTSPRRRSPRAHTTIGRSVSATPTLARC